MRVKLNLSNDDWRGLHEAVEKARVDTTEVKVSKVALQALLQDHGKLISEFKSEIGGNL